MYFFASISGMASFPFTTPEFLFEVPLYLDLAETPFHETPEESFSPLPPCVFFSVRFI